MSGNAVNDLADGVSAIPVRRVAVLGAGLMGGGIAAQFANAGLHVDLLDIPGPDASRNEPALAGIARQLKVGGFAHPAVVELVHAGNVEDDLGRLSEVDWVIEAIIEDLGSKRDIYKRVAAVLRPGAIVSSNTSTFRREDLLSDSASDFATHFVVTHFFNPPRMMNLVEVVGGSDVDEAAIALAREACATILGKTVVNGRDTPGFIANRIGCYWMAVAAIEAIRSGLRVEEADAVMRIFGTPRTGIFGLLDLIGIDLVPKVWPSLMDNLPPDDAINRHNLPAEGIINQLLASGRTGRKSGAGFYRQVNGKRDALDLSTGEYRPEEPVDGSMLPQGRTALATLIAGEGKLADYARAVLFATVQYAASCGPEVADSAEAIDTAMTLGYAWAEGPLRLADRVGVAQIVDGLRQAGNEPAPWLLAASGMSGFYNDTGASLLPDGTGYDAAAIAAPGLLTQARARRSLITGNNAASLWDIGDDIAVFEIHSKMNSLSAEVFEVLEATLAQPLRGLVVGNDDPRSFSAGADLMHFSSFMKAGDWGGLEAYVARGQDLMLRLKYAAFPSVAAAHGVALGGGAELMLHCTTIAAHAELTTGFPETTLGIVPAWGGCAQMLLRKARDTAATRGPVAVASAVFDLMFGGGNSSSARDARARGILRSGDTIVMNRGQLLARARQRALDLAVPGYRPPAADAFAAAGRSGRNAIVSGLVAARRAGRISDHDVVVGETLAYVLTGGAAGDPVRMTSEKEMMDLEREAIVHLAKLPATLARIEHLLATGKPLRK